jgi:hydrogenase/urease accessory protein HupE
VRSRESEAGAGFNCSILTPRSPLVSFESRLSFLAVAVLLCGAPGHAHPLAPSLLELREQEGGHVEVLWKTPRLQVVGAPVQPVLPRHCADLAPARPSEDAIGVTLRWRIDCGAGGLVGERVGVEGLAASRTEALVRLVLRDGRVVQRVLRAGEPFVTVPARPERRAVLHDYGRLGVEHILTGADHLLFVFGLLLLVPAAWPLAKTITAFTAGHSITLSLSVLGLAEVPSRPIEVAIALSVLALAVELARGPGLPTLMRRYPWAMALLFGLLHGLGFAGALREAGLPQGEIPLALLAFNCGIEAGQLLFVAALLLVRPAANRARERLPAWAGQVPVYVMGTLAAFWSFERAAALLP